MTEIKSNQCNANILGYLEFFFIMFVVWVTIESAMIKVLKDIRNISYIL